MKRRTATLIGVQIVLAGVLLAGCGFKLRGAFNYAFKTIAIQPNPGGAVASELRQSFGDTVQVLGRDADPAKAQVVLDVIQEQREKAVVGMSAAGQVREFQLRLRVKFRLRTPEGKELIPDTEILQQRDISFNESAVLAKEAEEGLLYRDMQSDIVQQLLRRLAAVRSL
jgi:LPS-assembly lipoprotein